MTGRYSLSVSSVNCNYFLELKQKYTIIRGASGTGKSIFADLVEQYTLDADSSGVSVSCEIPVMRLISDDNGTWQEKLENYSNVIFVVDEFDSCLHKVEGTFAKYANKSDCYFIIITRRTLGSLSYSIDSIYEFKSITNNDNALSSSEVVVPAYKTILYLLG